MYPWTGGGGGVWVGRTGKSWIVRAVRVKIFLLEPHTHSAVFNSPPVSAESCLSPQQSYAASDRLHASPSLLVAARDLGEHGIGTV